MDRQTRLNAIFFPFAGGKVKFLMLIIALVIGRRPLCAECAAVSYWFCQVPQLNKNLKSCTNLLTTGKEEYLYSTIYPKLLRHGSHSFTCKLHHACLSFVSVHQMSPPLTEVADIQ